MTTRLHRIPGTYNLRDLGGYRADGGTTRPGVFFRSDALANLDDAGVERFAQLGIRRVIDLRAEREIAAWPDRLPDGVEFIANPIFADTRKHLDEGLGIDEITELIYLQHGGELTRAVGLLAAEGDDARLAPALFHCTAGKDRTGAVAALTLLAVGVDRDDVVADYHESEQLLGGEWLETQLATLARWGVEVTPAIRAMVGTTPTATIERALADVEREYGSARDYLLHHGLPEASFDRLHARLVE